MSKLQNDYEAHKKEAQNQYEHFNTRMDQFANYLQSAMNPTVKLNNGEEKEIFMSEAVVLIYDDVKFIKKNLAELDNRTEILKDVAQIKMSWLELKSKLKKYLKPLFKFIVWCSALFIFIYLGIMIASGKMTLKQMIEYIIKIFF